MTDPENLIVSGLSREEYALLAQANLLRMRGQWQEAIDKCMEVMTLAPNNASAQSLLGDIYDNQGFLDDAIQWYRMALDIQPDSPADRMKLERLVERKSRQIPTLSAAPPAEPVPVTHESRVAPHVSAFTTDAFVRWAALLAGIFVVLVVIIALVQIRAASRVPEHQVNVPPVVVPTLAEPAGIPGTSVPSTAASNSRDPDEMSLLQKMQASSAISGTGMTVTDIQDDPRTGHLLITCTLPPPETGNQMRDTLYRASLAAAVAAYQATGPDITMLTLRIVAAPVPGGSVSLLSVMDITRATLSTAPVPAALPTGQIGPLFANVWWSSVVPA